MLPAIGRRLSQDAQRDQWSQRVAATDARLSPEKMRPGRQQPAREAQRRADGWRPLGGGEEPSGSPVRGPPPSSLALSYGGAAEPAAQEKGELLAAGIRRIGSEPEPPKRDLLPQAAAQPEPAPAPSKVPWW